MKSVGSVVLTLLVALACYPGTELALAVDRPARLRFQHLTSDDQLSHNWVQAILKDSRGFLWFGTQDGLNRYDGRSFTVYKHDPQDPESLPSPVAGLLLEDSQKRLWVGSSWGAKGLSLYDRARDRFQNYLPNPGQASGNQVRSMIEDVKGQLWIGTDAGVSRFDPEAGTFKAFPLDSDERGRTVVSLLEDRKGRLWVGTVNGLLWMDRPSGRFFRWNAGDEDPLGLNRSEISDLLEDEQGMIWVASMGGGLTRLDSTTRQEVHFRPDPRDPASLSHLNVRRLAADGQGRLYVGTENGGLDVLDKASGRFTHSMPDLDDDASLNSSSVYALRFDDQGILWIGTFNGGVNAVSPFGQRFELIRARNGGLSDPHVAAVLEDHKGQLWIGTDGGGLNKLERQTGAFTHYGHDPKDPTTIGSNAVLALFEDSRNNLWVGGYNAGLGLLDRATGRVQRFRHTDGDAHTIVGNHVRMIRELRSGELLVTTQFGVDLFDPQTRRFSRLSDRYPGAAPTPLHCADEDRNGDLWIGGQHEVVHIEHATKRITRYLNDPNDPNSRPDGWSHYVHFDSRGNVWFATDGGLWVLAAGTGKTRRYTTADGLPYGTVNGVLEDGKGNLWLSTNRGVASFEDAVHLPEKPRFLYFDVHDGLQGEQFTVGAVSMSSSGEMFMGGTRGLNIFRPDEIHQNPTMPRIVFTDLKILNRSQKPGAAGSPLTRTMPDTGAVMLSYKQSMITVDFAALSYVLPQKNRYSYKLFGFDPEWSAVSATGTATYTNLPAGNYQLRVKASNNDGVWNEQGVALQIRVTPPFWATLWFRTLVLIAFGTGLYSWYQGKMRAAADRRRELEELVKQRTADLEVEIGGHKRTEEQLKERNAELQSFADVASHDLQEPLRKVKAFAERLDTKWESLTRDEIADSHHRMLNAAQRMQALIAQLLAYARVGKVVPQLTEVDMAALAAEVLEDLEARIEQMKGRVEVGPLPRIQADPVQIRQLLQNLIGNALKFARPGEHPVVRVFMKGTTAPGDGAPGLHCEIAVQDNGIGFEQAEADRVFRPFYRVHTRQQYEGTGLGLAICQKIVERHRGTIRAMSAPGEGTTFFFTLPLAVESSPAAKSA